jgi:hypothetical protein
MIGLRSFGEILHEKFEDSPERLREGGKSIRQIEFSKENRKTHFPED